MVAAASAIQCTGLARQAAPIHGEAEFPRSGLIAIVLDLVSQESAGFCLGHAVHDFELGDGFNPLEIGATSTSREIAGPVRFPHGCTLAVDDRRRRESRRQGLTPCASDSTAIANPRKSS